MIKKNLNLKFKIKKVESTHLNDIAEFLVNEKHGEFSKEEWLNKFNLFWKSNPWFDKKKHCRGWVIISDDQKVQGFIGSVPVAYLREGKFEEAFWGTTWIVSKQARGQSLNLYYKFIEQNGTLFSTSTEPKIKDAITYLFGYDELSPLWLKYKYTLPLSLSDSFKFVSYYYRGSLTKKIVYKLGSVFYKTLAFIHRIPDDFAKSKIRINICTSVPVDINEFNEKFVSKYNYVFPRNEDNIKWLYFSRGLSSSRLLLEVREGSELIGLVSFKCILSNGVARLELLDFSLLYVNQEVIKKIIIHTQYLAKKWRSNLAYITFFSFHEIMNVELVKSGFHKSISLDSFFIRTFPMHSKILNFYTSPIDGDRPFFP